MNFDALEKTWAKQTVTGRALPADAIGARLKGEVLSAQRRFRGAIVIAWSLLILEWVNALASHVTGFKPLTPLGLVALVIGSALYVLLLRRAKQSARAAQNEIAHLGGTLHDSAAATLRTIELQIENARVAAYAIPLVVGISAALFLAKYFAGEIHGIGAAFGCGFFTVLGAAIGAAFWHRYRTVLAPRRTELRETLRSLTQETSAPTEP